MAIQRVTLSTAVKRIGKAFVYVGDAFTAGGLAALGATEGEVSAEESIQYSDLQFPEYTGDMLHERKVNGQTISVTVPLIMGDPAVYNKIHPLGQASGGYSEPQAVVSTNLLIIPEIEVPSGGLATTAGPAWTAGQEPEHAIWIWKAVPEPGSMTFRHAEGGKIIREVTFVGMYDSARPDGHRLFTVGDPIAAGINVNL